MKGGLDAMNEANTLPHFNILSRSPCHAIQELDSMVRRYEFAYPKVRNIYIGSAIPKLRDIVSSRVLLEDLRFAETEIKCVENPFSGTPNDVKVMHNPTRMDVLSEFPEGGIVHFACHGFASEDPSQSCFYLKDWKASTRTVSDLTSMNSKSAKFAYLSACHTAATRDLSPLPESIILSSAVQLWLPIGCGKFVVGWRHQRMYMNGFWRRQELMRNSRQRACTTQYVIWKIGHGSSAWGIRGFI